MLSDLTIGADGSIIGYYLDDEEKKQMLLIQSNLQWFNNGRNESEQLDVELEVYDGNKASLYKGDTMIIGLQPLHVINMTIAAINNYLEAR